MQSGSIKPYKQFIELNDYKIQTFTRVIKCVNRDSLGSLIRYNINRRPFKQSN